MSDDDTAERGRRTITLGRKNHPFVGSEAGGKAAAIAYTLIETVRLNGVDPRATDTRGLEAANKEALSAPAHIPS